MSVVHLAHCHAQLFDLVNTNKAYNLIDCVRYYYEVIYQIRLLLNRNDVKWI